MGCFDLTRASAALVSLPRRTRQLLVVVQDGPGVFKAKVTTWELAGGSWQAAFPPLAATIGRNGFVAAEEKTEGDGCTPIGVYSLGLAFGSEAAASTAMPYRQTTGADCWIDDPVSPQYNRWVEGIPAGVSYEPMLRPDGLYRYGLVIEYNTAPVVAGKGSAIFMHLWRGGEPTAGCVALAEEDLLRILSWLQPSKQPLIILGGEQI
ncbi:MAG: L,D-transpeptidase family protein [Negativicutes bacterium]|nr:L,D-transpeptidase family protein [Negativicutes bacterium]